MSSRKSNSRSRLKFVVEIERIFVRIRTPTEMFFTKTQTSGDQDNQGATNHELNGLRPEPAVPGVSFHPPDSKTTKGVSDMAAVDYFLVIDGVKGESHDDKMKAKGAIDLESWSWGESQSGAHGAGGGGGAGKV